jgi:hypothetical protein
LNTGGTLAKKRAPSKRVTEKRISKQSLKKQAPEKRGLETLSKLSETEQDLLTHMEHGYQLETDSLGSDPVLRKSDGEEVIRPASATRNTVEALKERGLIIEAKSDDPLKIVWRRV